MCMVRASPSQFLQFQFSVGPDSTAIFGHATFQSFQKLRNMTHFARTLETGAKKTELAQELTINKKIVIFSPIQLIF